MSLKLLSCALRQTIENIKPYLLNAQLFKSSSPSCYSEMSAELSSDGGGVFLLGCLIGMSKPPPA